MDKISQFLYKYKKYFPYLWLLLLPVPITIGVFWYTMIVGVAGTFEYVTYENKIENLTLQSRMCAVFSGYAFTGKISSHISETEEDESTLSINIDPPSDAPFHSNIIINDKKESNVVMVYDNLLNIKIKGVKERFSANTQVVKYADNDSIYIVIGSYKRPINIYEICKTDVPNCFQLANYDVEFLYNQYLEALKEKDKEEGLSPEAKGYIADHLNKQ